MKNRKLGPAVQRYSNVSDEKSGGVTYTPKILADFVADQIVSAFRGRKKKDVVRVLEPSVGHGELLNSLLHKLKESGYRRVVVIACETDPESINITRNFIANNHPDCCLELIHSGFLEYVTDNFGSVSVQDDMFESAESEKFDIIIANPPYVRTQVLGAKESRILSQSFDLSGRVDLYYAFLLAMSLTLKPNGVAGVIVSNRFMTTKSGGVVRKEILQRYNVRHVWDMGDTRFFKAAVLPAVLLLEGVSGEKKNTLFTSIYECMGGPSKPVENLIEALNQDGVVEVQEDGRLFKVSQGVLSQEVGSTEVWRLATESQDDWLQQVKEHTWNNFKSIGKIRVGVKSCADKVFIRKDWDSVLHGSVPELLKPLTTHKVARRFKPTDDAVEVHILYPHISVDGKRSVLDIDNYPVSKAYLESHRKQLESRTYLIEAGRRWYELWVPQDPGLWNQPKLVFRDISEKPTFWMDLDGSVVNGDCYWMVADSEENVDLLWLACAIANSTFIEKFYDNSFNNKLYSGRRRFITQYVEKFPLPDPELITSRKIIELAKEIYKYTPSKKADLLQIELDALVSMALLGAPN
ncbi:Eco57I restriction-modification methylase domain-containing protein [Thalassolituus sp.]|uniref:Eco57I restriction-modification methylase domain-containing protein n=1 Tax=Thalassolituus sp. TaxID=2030822 RepID=UPI003514C2D7